MDTSAKTFIIPDKSLQRGIACCWRSGYKFNVYARSQIPSKNESSASCDLKLCNIRPDVILFTPALRKLVNESNGTFLSLQKSVEAAKNSDNQVELLKLSRQYRSVIRVCLENLQEAATVENNPSVKKELLSHITIFYSVECIWHLCEILFVDNVPGDVVLPFILEWVRFHFPCHEQASAQILEACERGSESHDDYWDSVVGMVVQGRLEVARALLRLHSLTDSNEFKQVDSALRTMPVYSVYGGISTGEFNISWKHWQLECKAKLSSRCFASQPHLELIMRLIVGEYSAFEEVRQKYESWYDVFGGWLLYTEPTARRFELGKHAHACAGLVDTSAGMKHLDHILLALMEYDLHQVISEIQNMADNGWFATHLVDILYHCGKLKILDRQQENVTTRLRESLILEYGSILMEHSSLWAVGLSYLAGVSAEGLQRAELLLERLPLGSEARIMKLLAEAKKYNLHNAVRTICASAGARCLSAGRAGGALAWAVRGRSAVLAARAADVLLRDYTVTGKLRCADLLLSLGPSMLLSDRLVFLGKYCEFHRLYKSRDFKSAGTLLVSLLTSKIAPDYFWATLLLDTLPLLESDEPIFTSLDTFEIMSCLEYHGSDLGDEEKVELLRLALARNLARTMLEDDDDDMEND